MHASIAHAIYRGERRQFVPRMNAAESRFKRMTYRFGRGPWLRTAIAAVTSSPHFVPIYQVRGGEKKHEIVVFMGYLHPDVMQDFNAWCGSSYMLHAKKCTMERQDLPLMVPHHTVLRLMERADIANPTQALIWTLPAVQYVLMVERDPPDEEVLLPCAAGAVVAIRDKVETDTWVFVTYLDEDKLRQEQRAEIEDRKRQLKEKLATYGFYRLLQGERGGRAFLA